MSRHLHVATLVNVVKGLFRDIEDLMGLPPRLGICSNKDVTPGLFEDGNFLKTAEVIIKGEGSYTGCLESGEGGTPALRKCIGIVKDLLL